MKHLVGVALAVAAMAACGAGAVEVVSSETRLAQYERMTPNEIAWGKESRDGWRNAVIDPPYFTPDRNRIEVIVFTCYTNSRARTDPLLSRAFRKRKAARLLSRAWRASLPDAVVVTRMPCRLRRSETDAAAKAAWALHQKLYFAAERLGAGDKAEEVLGRMAFANPYGFKRADRRALLARRIGTDAAALEHWAGRPEVAAKVRVANNALADSNLAKAAAGATHRWAASPEMIIDGKYVIDAGMFRHPRMAYRFANRLIREAIERGRVPGEPTDNATLADWMAPRSGEVFRRVRFGRPFGYKGVYSADRREFWDLDANGNVRHVHRLAGEGEWSYFTTKLRIGRRHPHVWRFARQYVSYHGAAGTPQRYGAFLLTDWLTAPETLWVGLPWRGQSVAMAFDRTADGRGRVEARNDKGSLFGTWWLEAGNLNVSFGELGVQSWPWREAAAHVGFEVPQRSLTPWRS